MKNKMLTQDEIVSKVTKVLDIIIVENLESISQYEFKTTPRFGYQKFYLNHTDGTYDMSLQSLIHYILYEEGIYKQILNEDQFAKCMKVIEDEPEAIYSPSGDSVEDHKIQELLDAIYDTSIVFTGRTLIAMGLDVYSDFEDYLNDCDSQRSQK
jgi:hypothetical protein